MFSFVFARGLFLHLHPILIAMSPRVFAWTALLSILGASCASASFPLLESNQPLGVVAGQETDIQFKGKRLGDAYAAIADLPGIEIIQVKPVNAAEVSVTVKADADVKPGLYPIRLVTKTGISNIKLIGVGHMPITKEIEPNNRFDQPQMIGLDTSLTAFGTTIEGISNREDVDYFQVQLKEGQRLTAEIEGIRLAYLLVNRNILDPYIAILDEDQFEVVSSDDSSLLGQDGVCSFVAPKAGRYTVMVRDSSFIGGPICGYRLHLGSFPRPMGVFPGGGIPGQSLTVQADSPDGSTATFETVIPGSLPNTTLDRIRPTDRWPLVAKDESGISPSPNWIRVNDLEMVFESEPNDNFRKADPHPLPAAFCGTVERPGDFDCFGFDAKKGQKYRVQCFARNPLRSPLDAVMNVYGPNQKSVASSDDVGESKDPLIEFTCPSDGRYAIRIYDHLRGGSDLHHYRIEVTLAKPTFTTLLKETRRDHATTASVPIGGSMAVMAQVRRSGYGGPIEFSVEGTDQNHVGGIPDGVTATCFEMPKGRAEIPILFTASSDAECASGLFRIAGQSPSKDRSPSKDQSPSKDAGPLDDLVKGLNMIQQHRLVLGQNRRLMFDYHTDYAAIAVTERAPFEITLRQPQTPIVRRGSKNLKVSIVRDEGFDEEVRLRTLYNPPGISVNNSRRIAKGKWETDIPISANANAAMGTWPMILIATYKRAHGQAEITTGAILLDVEKELCEFKFPRVAVEQSADTTVAIPVQLDRSLPGNAEVQLAGLPAGVSGGEVKQTLTQDTKVLRFPIKVSSSAKAGKHKTLVCIASITVGNEKIVQTVGTGELRIDKPLPTPKGPVKKNAKKNVDQTKKANTDKAKAKKPINRLEQLRQMKESQ